MRSRSGFTLVEMLVGALIAVLVSTAAYAILSQLFGEAGDQLGRQSAQTELDELLTQLRRDWRARGAGTSYAAGAVSGFTGAGAPPCTGLTITQPVANGKADHTVTYATNCVSGEVLANAPKVHPSTVCGPGERSEVTVTRTDASGAVSLRRYSAATDVLSVAACFRVVPGTGVTAEFGALSRKGRGAAHLRIPLYLSETDRSPSVQIFVK